MEHMEHMVELWDVDTRPHSAVKDDVVEALIKVFEESGEKYTNEAAFFSVVSARAYRYAAILHGLGYEFSNSKYFPVDGALVRFCSWAAKEYRKRNFK